MKIGIQTCTCRRLRIQGFHGTYGAEGNFAKTKSKSEHCVLSMLKRKMKVEIVNCVLSEKKVKVEIVSSVQKKIQLSTNILSCTNPTVGKQYVHIFFWHVDFLMFVLSIL